MKSRYLIVKLGAFGDLFYAAHLPRILKELSPDSQIEWLVSENLSSAARLIPGVDRIVTIDDRSIKKSIFHKMIFFFRFRRRVKGFDTVFVFHRHPAFAWAFWGRVPAIYQISRDGRKLFGAHFPLFIPPMIRHERLAYEDLLSTFQIKKNFLQKALSISGSPPAPFLKFHVIELPHANRNAKPKLTLHLGGGENSQTQFVLKQWPYFPELIRELSPHFELRLVGSKDDRKSFAAFLDGDREHFEDYVGKTDFSQLANIISESDFFVGPDSGPLHLADFLNIPSLGLYGPTSPQSWGLLHPGSRTIFHSVPCQPCYRDDGIFPPCPNEHICMRHLSSATVLKELFKLTRMGTHSGVR